jgi:hypothetical protein
VARFKRELHCGEGLLDEGLDYLGWQLSNRTAITTDRKKPVVATKPDQRRTMARMHVRDDAAVRQHTNGAVHRRLVDGRLFDLREPCQLGRIDRATVAKQCSQNGNAWGGCSAAMVSQDRFGIFDRPAVDDRCLFFVQPHWERAIT